jgi:hypothetical protein
MVSGGTGLEKVAARIFRIDRRIGGGRQRRKLDFGGAGGGRASADIGQRQLVNLDRRQLVPLAPGSHSTVAPTAHSRRGWQAWS